MSDTNERREELEAEDAAVEETGEDTAVDEADDVEADAGPEAAAEPEPSPEEVLRRERDEYQDRFLRSAAELENFRKRMHRQVEDSRRFANADLMRSLLDVLDNFERAMQSMAEDDGEDDLAGYREGVDLIFQRLNEVLREAGLGRIEVERGDEFDPRWHEAVGQLPSEEFENGQIVEIAQPGYRLHDMVLRPTRVIVAS